MSEYAVVGQRLARLDAPEKATGQARFAADINLPGMLWARVLRSPFLHARLRRLDTSKAEALPGVKAVVTYRDVSDTRLGFVIQDEPLFARDRVLYVGDRVAAVAATDPVLAEEALDLIEVDYEPLPAVLDPLAGMEAGAPLLHENLDHFGAIFKPIRYGNVASEVRIRKGDVAQGFAEAEFIMEETFHTPVVHHSYLEPVAAVATTDASGRLTVWFSTQTPFGARDELSHLLHLPLNKIRVISSNVGGGFGGKEPAWEAAIAALLALKTGHPVKLVLSREEDFQTTHPRHPSIITLKMGFKRDGTLVAAQGKVVVAGGAYAGFGPQTTATASRLLFSRYRVPHVWVDAYCVYTNAMTRGAMRAPGAPQAHFATEQMMDMAAHRLGVDPIELRLRNAVDNGDTSSTGQVYDRIALRQTLERIKETLPTPRPPRGRRGIGVACGAWHTGGMMGSCQIVVNQDGTIGVRSGATDVGQGSTTTIAQIIAEHLGVRLEDVTMVTADTEATPFDRLTGGSSVTYRMGNAATRAAQEVREKLLRLAAEKLEANVADLELRDRRIFVKGSPERSITLAEAARLSHTSAGEGPITGGGSFIGRPPAYDAQHNVGFPLGGAALWPTFGTQLAEVEVDEETGSVRLLRLLVAQDVGFAINPINVEGQIEGGAVMGVGFALTEAMIYQDGKVQNPNLLDYKIPTALDTPEVQSLLVEEKTSDPPFGAKGVGELPIVPTAAAIANAIADAAGVRITELPLTAERIKKALQERRT